MASAEGRGGGYAVASAPAAPAMAGATLRAGAAAHQLKEYLESCYVSDEAMSAGMVRSILGDWSQGDFDWSMRSDDDLPLLHLAVMNEATQPEELEEVLRLLLARGAPLDDKDGDGDTALEAILVLAEEEPADADDEPVNEERIAARQIQLTVIRTLLVGLGDRLELDHAKKVCGWLRRSKLGEGARAEVVHALGICVGEKRASELWASEDLLAYLERCAYEEKSSVEASKVRAFLDRGASPRAKQNGATALLLVVLNPYSRYEELVQVFRLFFEREPLVATDVDGFKWTAVSWASDYANVASQHGCTPNPAVLLALLPAVCALVPAGADAGERCMKISPAAGGMAQVRSSASQLPATRFLEGDRVLARVEAPGGAQAWEEGVVTGLWHRERSWPAVFLGAPYEIRLDIGGTVFALVDDDRLVQRESRAAMVKAAASELAALPRLRQSDGQGTEDTVARSGPRFQRRRNDGGAWEMLDTVSGRTRPCSPPDSDDE